MSESTPPEWAQSDPWAQTDPLAQSIALLADRRSTPVRSVFAAAHVVLQPSYSALGHRLDVPGDPGEIADHIDWDTTLAFRRHLDDHGFGIAEAMDTAQRFFLGWPSAQRLIRECGALAPEHGFIAGAGTDQLRVIRDRTALIDAVVEQVAFIQSAGGIAILLPHPWIVEQRYDESAYVDLYREIIAAVEGPLLVHWLGEMFHPGLRGYFPGDSFRKILALDPAKVRGCKLSLLDAAFECDVRRELLPRDQVVFTGDDFHFGPLILGGDPAATPVVAPPIERVTELGGAPLALGDFSHGLLGVFDAIARPASIALRLLALGEVESYVAIMGRCEALGQKLFEVPTQHYKVGLAHLAYLAGHQENAMLVNREDAARDSDHLREVTELAFRAGVFDDPAAASRRCR